MKKSKKIIIAFAVTIAVALIGVYFLLPAINVYSKDFWIMLLRFLHPMKKALGYIRKIVHCRQ